MIFSVLTEPYKLFLEGLKVLLNRKKSLRSGDRQELMGAAQTEGVADKT